MEPKQLIIFDPEMQKPISFDPFTEKYTLVSKITQLQLWDINNISHQECWFDSYSPPTFEYIFKEITIH